MVVFLIIYVLVCLYGVKICTSNSRLLELKFSGLIFNNCEWNDYLSKEKTNAIKGIFVIMVFISHFSFNVTNSPGDAFVHELISSRIGQLMVTMFLFYSGYGIMESVKSKGSVYVKNMPVQRVLKLLFDFDIAILVYLLLNIILGKQLTVKKVMSALVSWDNLGNSNWYIFAILCLYIFSFVAFTIFKKNYYAAAAVITVLCGIYCIAMKQLKEDCWFNTVICYAFGIWFSLFRKLFEKIVQHNNYMWAIFLALSVLIFFVSYLFKNKFIIYELNRISFVLSVLLLTMKVSFDNKILRAFGKLVFGVYILQKIPMMIFKHVGLIDNYPYFSFIVCFGITFLLALGFNYLMKNTAKLFNKFRITE